MAEPIGRVVFGGLLSLALFGLVSKTLDWMAEKAPWDTDKTKTCILIIISIIAVIGLIVVHNKKLMRKQSKYGMFNNACGNSNRLNVST